MPETYQQPTLEALHAGVWVATETQKEEEVIKEAPAPAPLVSDEQVKRTRRSRYSVEVQKEPSAEV